MAVSRVINLQHHRIAQVSIAFVSSSCLPHLQLVMFLPISVRKALLCALSYPSKEHPPGWKWARPAAIWAWNCLLAFIVVRVRPPIQIQISLKTQQMVYATQGQSAPCHPSMCASSGTKATVAREALCQERECLVLLEKQHFRTSLMQSLLAVSDSEDSNPGRRRSSCASGWRSLDPASGLHLDCS